MSNHSCSNTSIPELCQGHGRQWLHVPSPGTVKSTKCTPNCEILYQDSPSNRGSLDNYWGRSRRLCGYQLGNVPAYLEPYHPPSSSFLHGTQLPSMPGPLVFRQPINRPNLLLCVRPKPAKMEEAFPLVLQYLIKEQGVTLVQSSERRVSLPPPLSVIGGKKKVSQEKGAKMRRKSKGKKEKKEKAARTAGIVDTFVRNATQNNHASGNKKNTGMSMVFKFIIMHVLLLISSLGYVCHYLFNLYRDNLLPISSRYGSFGGVLIRARCKCANLPRGYIFFSTHIDPATIAAP